MWSRTSRCPAFPNVSVSAAHQPDSGAQSGEGVKRAPFPDPPPAAPLPNRQAEDGEGVE